MPEGRVLSPPLKRSKARAHQQRHVFFFFFSSSQAAVSAAGGLAKRQHRFRRGRSTIDAVREVVEAARNVKNAFNSVRWPNILDALEHDFHVPKYLLAILGHYLQDRYLLYETEEAQVRRELTAGVAQGSVLGPELWNISYNGVFHLPMLDVVFLNGYADDIVAIVIARTKERAEALLDRVLTRVKRRMEERGLEIAATKTEVGILSKKRLSREVPMTVSTELTTKPVVKYLEVYLDTLSSTSESSRGLRLKGRQQSRKIWVGWWQTREGLAPP